MEKNKISLTHGKEVVIKLLHFWKLLKIGVYRLFSQYFREKEVCVKNALLTLKTNKTKNGYEWKWIMDIFGQRRPGRAPLTFSPMGTHAWASAGKGKRGLLPHPLADQGLPKIVCFYIFWEKIVSFLLYFRQKVGFFPLENFCPPLEKSLRTPMRPCVCVCVTIIH